MKTKQYIDNSRFIEIVSDLADQIVEATFGEYTWVYDKENKEHKYSEDAQDLFNDKYDEIESIFNVFLTKTIKEVKKMDDEHIKDELNYLINIYNK